MIGQITEAVIVLFLMVMAFVYKINFFDFFMEEKGGKLSSRRLGMFVCIWLLVWTVKTIIPMETISKEVLIVMAFVGVLAFSPRLLNSIVKKLTETYKPKE